jgi:hypothetical protein
VAIACRMAVDGRVTVSERRSIIFMADNICDTLAGVKCYSCSRKIPNHDKREASPPPKRMRGLKVGSE